MELNCDRIYSVRWSGPYKIPTMINLSDGIERDIHPDIWFFSSKKAWRFSNLLSIHYTNGRKDIEKIGLGIL